MNKASNIVKSSFFKVSSLNAVNVLVKIAGGLLASIMIATFLGPAGMALTGNFRNLLTAVDTFSTLGLQNGIIKYVAEFEKDERMLRRFLTTLFFTVLAAILLSSAGLLLCTGTIGGWVFPLENSYGWIIKVLALLLPLYTGNLIFVAILSGLGNYRQVIGVTIWGNVAGVLLSALLIWQAGIEGAFFGLILSPLLQLLPAYYLLQKRFPRLLFLATEHFDTKLLRGLLSYSIMAMATALLGAVIFISIRNRLLLGQGPEYAGYWEAMNRLSTFYMMFATTLLTVYYLPLLAAAGNRAATAGIIMGYYKNLVPLFAFGLLIVYLLRHRIVIFTLSREFMPLEALFAWQLAGDFLRVCSLILAYQFFARKMTVAYLVSEVLSFGVLYVSAQLLIPIYGTEGAVMAHCITYAAYLAGLALFFRKTLLSRPLEA